MIWRLLSKNGQQPAFCLKMVEFDMGANCMYTFGCGGLVSPPNHNPPLRVLKFLPKYKPKPKESIFGGGHTSNAHFKPLPPPLPLPPCPLDGRSPGGGRARRHTPGAVPVLLLVPRLALRRVPGGRGPARGGGSGQGGPEPPDC